MNRRTFSILATLGLAFRPYGLFARIGESSKFTAIAAKANEENWKQLPLGELIGRIALEFVGTPYVGGTLEGDEVEKCKVTLDGLDCVTLFENVFAFAIIIKQNNVSFTELVNRVEFTRYRSGKVDGYLSRLHYTADWIRDNVKKGTVEDVTKRLGGKRTMFALDFMSTHPKYYKPLTDNPKLVKTLKKIEAEINATPRWVIPQADIAQCESELQTGDIIAITTSKKGLDYSHTGLILRKDGNAHFLHASSAHKKVMVDGTISEYVRSVTAHTGISVVRPLDA